MIVSCDPTTTPSPLRSGDDRLSTLIATPGLRRIADLLLTQPRARAVGAGRRHATGAFCPTYGPAIAFAGCYVYGCNGTPTALTGWPFSYYAPLITLMIFGLMWRQTRLSGFFGSALLVAGGEASYSMYLLHSFVLEYFHEFAFRHTNIPVILSYFAAIFVTIAIARITYLIFERNATRFIRSKFIAYNMHIGVPVCLALIVAASPFLSHQMSAIQAAAGP